MARAITIAALVGMLAATPAVANEGFTADTLHRFCEGSGDFCVGFAAGVMNGMVIGRWGTESGVCLPQAVMTFGQLQGVIAKYLRGHPEQWHNPATFVVAMAISTAWPNACVGEAAQ
jgi:Rap1a immunity proteins